MSNSVNSNVTESEKPVSPSQSSIDIFPPVPEPTDTDFEEDIGKEERDYYKLKYIDLNDIKNERLHCTSCDRHLGCVILKSNQIKMHPMLRTLVCNTCHTFYNSGEFEKGDDGSELYCRWCGQGGQVYCCSDCPHVFCAKCIKRNLGQSKIKEIENTDDWKCFKCTPRCLWDLRALCWAMFRYYDFKNKIIDSTSERELHEKYIEAVENDASKCCREKRKRQSTSSRKKEEKSAENSKKKEDKKVDEKPPMIKFPSTIQVKKFASINLSESDSGKKAVKRPASPKAKINYMAKPIAIAPYVQPVAARRAVYPLAPLAAKRMRVPNIGIVRHVAPVEKRTFIGYSNRMIRPNPQMTIPFSLMDQTTNGYNNYVTDNLNLSIENLTQGLDMGTVAAMAGAAAHNNTSNDDLVCTPDFPLEHLEPLCEVNEDNTDDDVECISPAPTAKNAKLYSARNNKKKKENEDNIVQMTENDVTVNALTGGLKFRVDPQTLSSNKMYRLPDGRIFAINPNPNMPGGYSATIVAVGEPAAAAAGAARGTTYAAKVSAVSSAVSSANPPPLSKFHRINVSSKPDRRPKPSPKPKHESLKSDMKVPVEWYRFNLVDAVDALEYSLMRLRKLKKEVTTAHLRTRSVQETRRLHRTLDRLLNTSESRFADIRQNLNKGFKNYLNEKARSGRADSEDEEEDDDDDDDVEILPNDDDPIFIDENSVDSIKENTENQEIDIVSSDLNDSGERNSTISFTKVASVMPETSVNTDDSTNNKNENPLSEESTQTDLETSNKTNDNVKNDKDETDAQTTHNLSNIDEKDNSQNKVEMSEPTSTNEKNSKVDVGLPDITKDLANKTDKSDDTESLSKNKNLKPVKEDEDMNSETQAAVNKSTSGSKCPDDENNVPDDKIEPADSESKNYDDSEMAVDATSNSIEDKNNIGDVDMSADIIDSLLNDNVDERVEQNDDKSIESEEFII